MISLQGFFLLILFFTAFLSAQTPGVREDLESERRKVLRTADLVDSIQSTQEQLQTDLADFKTKNKSFQEQIESLQTDNQKLRSDLVALKTAIEKSEESRVKEREILIKEIGVLISEKTKSYPQTHGDALLKVRDEEKSVKSVDKNDKEESAPKEKGFYHVVEKGHTLSGISEAFKQQGVSISIDEIRKANNLSKTDVIHVGQKLFIPKK